MLPSKSQTFNRIRLPKETLEFVFFYNNHILTTIPEFTRNKCLSISFSQAKPKDKPEDNVEDEPKDKFDCEP